MWQIDDALKKNEDLLNDNLAVAEQISDFSDEIYRIASEFGRIGELYDEIDDDFSRATKITNRKDLAFLFVAIGLLCTKWLIMGQIVPLDFDFKHNPRERERIGHKEGDKKAEEKYKDKKQKKYGDLKNERKNDSEEGYRTVGQIIFRSVPYDATNKTVQDIVANLVPDNLNGQSKRGLTWGHDPMFGWIFGTVNIMTRSVTFKTRLLDTHRVSERDFKIYENVQSTFPTEIYHAYMSFREDSNRLGAAVFKQGMHLYADKYTKVGLPIPFLSPEKALDLLEKGWNSVEAAAAIKKVLTKLGKNAAIIGVQFVISLIINEVIKAIHLMMYDEEKDGDIALYQVRTRNILTTANCISSSSNILFCAIFGVATKNPIEAAKRLDIGGAIEAIRQRVVNKRFVEDIKREYIREKLEGKILDTTDYDWWYLNEKGEVHYE